MREWPLTPDLQLSLKDYAGVGTLELHSLTHSMGTWRFTLGRNAQAQAFAEAFAARLNPPSPQEHDTSTQQHADALLEDEHPPLQGNWGLLRLWRFAKPYKGQLFLGFVLTLASTAATLVPLLDHALDGRCADTLSKWTANR